MRTKTFTTRQLVTIALMATLMAVCAWITVPLGPVPFTLQTFGVFLALCLLGGRDGTVAVVVYLLLGAFGVPGFSGFSGGMGTLLGPAGGYLVGFIAAALVFWLVTKHFGTAPVPTVIGMVLGLAVCYLFGTLWFVAVAASRPSFLAALGLCVVPYILPDAAKIALAYFLEKSLRGRIRVK